MLTSPANAFLKAPLCRQCLEPPAKAAGPQASRLGIDTMDTQLLRLLQRDGRITNTRLAETVGLSTAQTHERVKRLAADGFILGYEAVLNPLKLGGSMLVFAEVRLEDHGVAVRKAFKAAVEVRLEILECHEVAGSFDYLIKTRVMDMTAYRELIASVVWSLPGVREIRTYPVMEEVKNTARLSI